MDNNVDGDTMADDYNKILRHLQSLNIPESAIEEAAMEVDSKVTMADKDDVLNPDPCYVHSDSVVSIAETKEVYDLLGGEDIYGLPLLMGDYDDLEKGIFMQDHQAKWIALQFSKDIETNTLVRY
jgi:hypothetical protein